MLFSEYLAYGVRPDSPIKSAKDFAEALRKDPTRYSIAVATSRGGALHIATGLALKAAGVDVKKLRIVVFNANAESLTAMLGGHVDVAVSTVNSFVPNAQGGKLRVIAVRRRAGSKVLPTRQRGRSKASIPNTRAGADDGPARVERGADRLLGRRIRQTYATDEWRQDVEKNLWEVTFKGSRDTVREMEQHYDEMKRMLVDLELVK